MSGSPSEAVLQISMEMLLKRRRAKAGSDFYRCDMVGNNDGRIILWYSGSFLPADGL
jgi:hypothetical protein